MAADIFRLVKGFPHWLPGNTEIICILVIPDINIVAWPVHRDTVSAKTADAVIFRAFVKRISSCRVINLTLTFLWLRKKGTKKNKF